MKTVLVTGCAGFIGWAVSRKLLESGAQVLGIDNLNNYYDPMLKTWRLQQLNSHANFSFYNIDKPHNFLRLPFDSLLTDKASKTNEETVRRLLRALRLGPSSLH